MATPAQINALIAFILGLGPTVSGEDGLLGAIEDGIVESLFDLPRGEAVQAARDRAEFLRGILRNADVKRIASIIVDTLEKGKDFASATQRIRDNIGLLDSQERALEKLREQLAAEGRDAVSIAERLKAERKRLLQERAANIANTEIANATEEGNLRNALANGATHKVNIDAGDERVSKICQACTAQGVIDINEDFASGAQRPPHHNGCRCTAAMFTNPSQARLDRINARAEARLERIREGQEASEEELAQAGESDKELVDRLQRESDARGEDRLAVSDRLIREQLAAEAETRRIREELKRARAVLESRNDQERIGELLAAARERLAALRGR